MMFPYGVPCSGVVDHVASTDVGAQQQWGHFAPCQRAPPGSRKSKRAYVGSQCAHLPLPWGSTTCRVSRASIAKPLSAFCPSPACLDWYLWVHIVHTSVMYLMSFFAVLGEFLCVFYPLSLTFGAVCQFRFVACMHVHHTQARRWRQHYHPLGPSLPVAAVPPRPCHCTRATSVLRCFRENACMCLAIDVSNVIHASPCSLQQCCACISQLSVAVSPGSF